MADKELIMEATGVSNENVDRVVEMIPKTYLTNILDGRDWYTNEGDIISKQRITCELFVDGVWTWQGVRYIRLRFRNKNVRYIPTFVRPNVLEFIADNVDSISSTEETSISLINACIATVEVDWDNITIFTLMGEKITFTNGIPDQLANNMEITESIKARGWGRVKDYIIKKELNGVKQYKESVALNQYTIYVSDKEISLMRDSKELAASIELYLDSCYMGRLPVEFIYTLRINIASIPNASISAAESAIDIKNIFINVGLI